MFLPNSQKEYVGWQAKWTSFCIVCNTISISRGSMSWFETLQSLKRPLRELVLNGEIQNEKKKKTKLTLANKNHNNWCNQRSKRDFNFQFLKYIPAKNSWLAQCKIGTKFNFY
jgi:hypothetical protein